jgi:hypothetical protein
MKNNKLISFAPAITLIGTAVLLIGLAWDGVLHAADPKLAAEEGVMSLQNPRSFTFCWWY